MWKSGRGSGQAREDGKREEQERAAELELAEHPRRWRGAGERTRERLRA